MSELIANRSIALCLAQFVLSDEDYRRFYKGRKSSMYLILDNGLAEDGQPLSMGNLLDAVCHVWPNELVLPDFVDPCQNLEAYADAAHNASLARLIDKGLRIMFVPHGRTFGEWKLNLLEALEVFVPHSIGISKFHSTIGPQAETFGRGMMGTYASCHAPDAEIHYLGLSLPPTELMYLQQGRSCDTCLATMSAYHDISFTGAGMLYRPEYVQYEHNAVLSVQAEARAVHNMTILDELAGDVG
jgi:hypothetical protein